jgi:hypothetical protein
MRLLARWLPGRELVLVADASFSALRLLHALAPRMTCITRLRLDARLYAAARPKPPGRRGPQAKTGPRVAALAQVLHDPATPWQRVLVPQWYGMTARAVDIASDCALWHQDGRPVLPLRWVLIRDPLGHFDAQALLCTTPTLAPLQVVQYFVRRWQLEVTFEEVRRHLGVETQRQWSARAIARTTPVLLGLFSLVTLWAHQLSCDGRLDVRQAAWYVKPAPTFSDALAAVRAHWWSEMALSVSACDHDTVKLPRSVWRRLHEAACYAA